MVDACSARGTSSEVTQLAETREQLQADDDALSKSMAEPQADQVQKKCGVCARLGELDVLQLSVRAPACRIRLMAQAVYFHQL